MKRRALSTSTMSSTGGGGCLDIVGVEKVKLELLGTILERSGCSKKAEPGGANGWSYLTMRMKTVECTVREVVYEFLLPVSYRPVTDTHYCRRRSPVTVPTPTSR